MCSGIWGSQGGFPAESLGVYGSNASAGLILDEDISQCHSVLSFYDHS